MAEAGAGSAPRGNKKRGPHKDTSDGNTRKKRRQAKGKTGLCREWQSSGACKFGSDCKFAHGLKELSNDGDDPVMAAQRALKAQVAALMTGDPKPAAPPGLKSMSVSAMLGRYYTILHVAHAGGAPGHHQYVLTHGNGMCVIGLAAGHPALTSPSGIASVAFEEEFLHVQTAGKKKQGSARVSSTTRLATVKLNDGTTFPVLCGVNGVLFEANTALGESPDLLAAQPDTLGHLAVIKLTPEALAQMKASFLSTEEFKEAVARGLEPPPPKPATPASAATPAPAAAAAAGAAAKPDPAPTADAEVPPPPPVKPEDAAAKPVDAPADK